ncbi:MAG: cytoplasmic protein [Methylobacterium sp. CG08_land_8_20_14_0_20_71_15]|nr:MAG: cytoplasmic protein [Methylobacterium sp. CG09_land_8_20_14_0_10_71_15]PIU11291.1 MAG: cytoplasmic protein [Methylobacterium sp. CG08_land_8_20_14_0_20_71_15]
MLKAAHRHSFRHGDEVRSSPLCGCFYCLETFAPDEVVEWIDDDSTALCPRCGVDAVIGEMSGYPVGNAVFLRAMHQLWF